MTAVGVVTAESLAEDLAAIYMPGGSEPESESVVKFEDFTEDFQSKIAALVLRDTVFCERTEGLIKPDYFDNAVEGTIVNIVLGYFKKYKRVPEKATFVQLLKEGIASKAIRGDIRAEIGGVASRLYQINIEDRDYAVDQVSEFAKHQAFAAALLKSVELLDKREFDKAFALVKGAMEVGANEDIGAKDYWVEIEERTERRKLELAGTIKKTGIDTGIFELNKRLYHRGWGRKELTLFMGGPKVGKSTALAHFAKNASLAGFSVLIVTLEVSADIYTERLDANIADIAMTALGSKILEVQEKVAHLAKKAGTLKVNEFPAGTFTPSMLRRLIDRYKAQGITFDMVVVDYLDLMAPNYRSGKDTEDSKNIYTDVRAIAQVDDIAILSATQTNREGVKSAVAKMEHVAEDFNRIRIADLVISINRNDEDRARNEARLFMAASRNQGGELTIKVQQDLERMNFIRRIISIEGA